MSNQIDITRRIEQALYCTVLFPAVILGLVWAAASSLHRAASLRRRARHRVEARRMAVAR